MNDLEEIIHYPPGEKPPRRHKPRPIQPASVNIGDNSLPFESRSISHFDSSKPSINERSLKNPAGVITKPKERTQIHLGEAPSTFQTEQDLYQNPRGYTGTSADMKPAGYSIPNPEHITCRSIGPDRSNFETTTRSVFSDTKERSLPKAPHLKPHTDPGGFDIVKNEKEDQNQHFAYERYTDNANRRYVSLETTQRNRMVGTRSYVQDNEPHPLGSSTKTRAFGSTQAGGRSQPQSFLPQSSYNIITGG